MKKLRRGSSNSYAAIKKLVWESEFKQWHEYAQLELELQKSLSYTEDFKEGVRAHSERRRPKFIGEIKKHLHYSLKFDILFLVKCFDY